MPLQIRQGIEFVRLSVIEKKASLFRSIFTPREIQYCTQKLRKFEHYGARYAAKKAILKLLPSKVKREITLTSIEILNAPSGVPYVQWSQKLMARFPFLKTTQVEVSLSHERKIAAAAAVLIHDH